MDKDDMDDMKSTMKEELMDSMDANEKVNDKTNQVKLKNA